MTANERLVFVQQWLQLFLHRRDGGRVGGLSCASLLLCGLHVLVLPQTVSGGGVQAGREPVCFCAQSRIQAQLVSSKILTREKKSAVNQS